MSSILYVRYKKYDLALWTLLSITLIGKYVSGVLSVLARCTSAIVRVTRDSNVIPHLQKLIIDKHNYYFLINFFI